MSSSATALPTRLGKPVGILDFFAYPQVPIVWFATWCDSSSATMTRIIGEVSREGGNCFTNPPYWALDVYLVSFLSGRVASPRLSTVIYPTSRNPIKQARGENTYTHFKQVTVCGIIGPVYSSDPLSSFPDGTLPSRRRHPAPARVAFRMPALTIRDSGTAQVFAFLISPGAQKSM